MDQEKPPAPGPLTASHEEIKERLSVAEKAQAARERKAVQKIELIRDRASAAATRLLEARPPGQAPPANAFEFMALVDSLAATSRKHGVLLSTPEKKAIRMYHAMIRAVIASQQAQEKAREDKAAAERAERLGITPTDAA